MPKQNKKEILEKKILAELGQTHKSWMGPKMLNRIKRNQAKISKATRDSVNNTGSQFGCHTCLSSIKTDRNQPWIGDHIPPTKLSNAARRNYNCPNNTVLYPQCDTCASLQSALVLKLNRMKSGNFPALSAHEKKLILGGTPKNGRISSSNTVVTAGEGIAIQALGVKNGCHSCKRRNPVSVYHSDHVYPQEFMTAYMPRVFQLLKIEAIDFTKLVVRPQCPRCSHRQGGKLRAIARLAIEVAKENNIPVYKW